MTAQEVDAEIDRTDARKASLAHLPDTSGAAKCSQCSGASSTFRDWYATHPSEPPPGDMLDASFDAQNQKISEIEALVEQIRRSDGQLQNAIVTKDALHPEVYGDLRYEMRFAAAAEALQVRRTHEKGRKSRKISRK